VNAPIFIVGANRSGTTLLRLILNAHSRIAIPEELMYFAPHLAGASLYRWEDPDLSSAQYARFVSNFLETNCAPLDLDTDGLRREILEAPPSLRRPYRRALEAWAQRHGKARWGEKTPGNLFFGGVIREMFPAAQFLYLARDPRAGVHSMNKTDFLPGDTVINALNRYHYAVEGLACLEQTVPADQRMMLRYEDLVAEPEATTRAVCAFLGERFEPAMLRFHEEAEQYMKQRAARTFNSSATRPIDASKIDAWKGRLSARDVSIIESICREEMERFGYEPSGGRPSLTTRFDVYAKNAYYQFQRWRRGSPPQYLLMDQIFGRSRQRLRRLRRRLAKSLGG
jgi:hypothetical protein